MDRSNPAHANEDKRNVGLQKRASFTDEGATVDLIERINSDVFFQDRFMLNEVSVKVRVVKNKDFLSHVRRSQRFLESQDHQRCLVSTQGAAEFVSLLGSRKCARVWIF